MTKIKKNVKTFFIHLRTCVPFQRQSIARRSVVKTGRVEMSAGVTASVSQVAELVHVKAVLRRRHAGVESRQVHLQRYVAASLHSRSHRIYIIPQTFTVASSIGCFCTF